MFVSVLLGCRLCGGKNAVICLNWNGESDIPAGPCSQCGSDMGMISAIEVIVMQRSKALANKSVANEICRACGNKKKNTSKGCTCACHTPFINGSAN